MSPQSFAGDSGGLRYFGALGAILFGGPSTIFFFFLQTKGQKILLNYKINLTTAN